MRNGQAHQYERERETTQDTSISQACGGDEQSVE